MAPPQLSPRLVSRQGSRSGFRGRLPERLPSPLWRRFLWCRRRFSPSDASWRLRWCLASGTTQRLWMSITGSSSICRLKDCPVVIGLHELGPFGRRTTGGRDGRRLERFAEMCQDLPDRPRLGCNAMSRVSPPHPGHSSGNSSPTRAMSLAQAFPRGVVGTRSVA
jgi:hypothetical protein